MIFQNIFVWLVWIFCFKTLSKRFGITAIGKPVGEVDVLTFRTKRTFDMILASPHQGTQSVLIFEPCLTCNKQNSWPKHPSGAVQRVMFYRSQAGIRAWPGKSNTPVWEGTGSPSAETQCWETKHKSINMAEVLKRKGKGSVNTSHYDLWGTYRSVGDFRKTGEVTWKGKSEFGDSKKGSWCWLSSKLVGFPGSWKREARDSLGCVNGVEVPEINLSTIISYLVLSMYSPAISELSQSLSNVTSPFTCTPCDLALWRVFGKWTGHWIFSSSLSKYCLCTSSYPWWTQGVVPTYSCTVRKNEGLK